MIVLAISTGFFCLQNLIFYIFKNLLYFIYWNFSETILFSYSINFILAIIFCLQLTISNSIIFQPYSSFACRALKLLIRIISISIFILSFSLIECLITISFFIINISTYILILFFKNDSIDVDNINDINDKHQMQDFNQVLVDDNNDVQVQVVKAKRRGRPPKNKSISQQATQPPQNQQISQTQQKRGRGRPPLNERALVVETDTKIIRKSTRQSQKNKK
jgi:hypothetical protein